MRKLLNCLDWFVGGWAIALQRGARLYAVVAVYALLTLPIALFWGQSPWVNLALMFANAVLTAYLFLAMDTIARKLKAADTFPWGQQYGNAQRSG